MVALRKGLAEIRRVLKPGGVAYVGRGLPERMSLETAKKLRESRGEGPKYDPNQTEQQLREIMKSLRIESYRIHRPHLNNAEGVNYGLWLEFRKPPYDRNSARDQHRVGCGGACRGVV